ncbi:hypothetical protein [Roseinatronobacter alkalisoli]|uniref:Uncharacterized protein n=1 Tax=Roseinatronobacter alkalisoli TaxID=3028235 RepID=A0ABT5TG66_9RHOB|nr:hypothetical protein [Roseinatronobacter sp. HJB301]MDD7973366.1 hypothetical protein [Roseinatronobacter sp. HJB301]
MKHIFAHPFLRRSVLVHIALAGGLFLLAACNQSLATFGESQSRALRSEWQATPLQNAWIYAPNAQMLLARRDGRISEQQIALSNQTALPRDNFIYLRMIPGQSPGVMRLRDVLEQSGGLPEPFTEDDLQVMRTTEDAAGALTWAEWSNGAGTTCVLAVRRMTVQTRVLPRNAGALDLLMRNCVRGSAQAALEPASAGHVGQPARGTASRTLAPLAAPAP